MDYVSGDLPEQKCQLIIRTLNPAHDGKGCSQTTLSLRRMLVALFKGINGSRSARRCGLDVRWTSNIEKKEMADGCFLFKYSNHAMEKNITSKNTCERRIKIFEQITQCVVFRALVTEVE